MQILQIRSSVAGFLVLGIALAGCAEPANQAAMVPGQIALAPSSSPYKQNISSVSGFGGEETNPLWTSEISKEEFQKALEASIKRAGLYSDRGRYSLRADILSVEQPLVGLDLKVTMTVRYNLTDANGRIRFDETITSEYTATFSEAFVAIERLKKANEGVARENISKFLKRVGVSASGGSVAAIS
ncbi:hypothetical protein LZA78_02440 [Sinirhodobacter sp. WL0062]|uniref:Lipoprotein n=1 Tax=Rhodobacter flavimaris TaxID=2907145 RepID=A0ABS8YX92_9RHOB|nr:hypothetical protein [Sinirhodobacter sp. WL0062]